MNIPIELFERLDRWRLQQPGTMKPSRSPSIHWIVNLLNQEQKARNRKRARADEPAAIRGLLTKDAALADRQPRGEMDRPGWL